MKNLLVSLWRATLGRALYRLFGQRLEALEAEIQQANQGLQQATRAQYVELQGTAGQVSERLHELTTTTLELSELIDAIRRRLETREGDSDRVAADQARIASRLDTVAGQTAKLTERFGELDRHVRIIVAARWEEAAINRRLADIEDRLAASELSPGAPDSADRS